MQHRPRRIEDADLASFFKCSCASLAMSSACPAEQTQETIAYISGRASPADVTYLKPETPEWQS